MLSEREHRTLQEIEQRLARESPGLATQLRRGTGWHRRRWVCRGLDLAVAVSVLLAVLWAVVVSGPAVGAVVVIATFTFLLVIVRDYHFPYPRGRRRRR